jgi:exodeoxyribonuclease V alpha subunit
MLDVELFDSLVKSMPSEIRFLVVGDIDQLPSVGPGQRAPRPDRVGLVSSGSIDEDFPQGRAKSHRDERSPDQSGASTDGAFGWGPLRDFFLSPAAAPERALEMVKTLVSKRIPEVFGLDPRKDVQVLAPMYSGVVGVDNLNQELQMLLNPESAFLQHGKTAFRKSDKVMHIANDYEKMVFNGDIGQIARNRPGECHAGRGLRWSRGRVRPVRPRFPGLAYAVSVHKSQGSEYPAVVMVLMNQHYVMLKRNLLYTGLTRARRLAVLVGHNSALLRAVESNPSARRYTTLAARLADSAALPVSMQSAVQAVMRHLDRVKERPDRSTFGRALARGRGLRCRRGRATRRRKRRRRKHRLDGPENDLGPTPSE